MPHDRFIDVTRTSGDDFEAAYGALFPRAAKIAYGLLRNRVAAEDVAAEALARAYADWSRIASLSYRDGWVLRVATNLAIDAARRRRLRVYATSVVADTVC